MRLPTIYLPDGRTLVTEGCAKELRDSPDATDNERQLAHTLCEVYEMLNHAEVARNTAIRDLGKYAHRAGWVEGFTGYRAEQEQEGEP